MIVIGTIFYKRLLTYFRSFTELIFLICLSKTLKFWQLRMTIFVLLVLLLIKMHLFLLKVSVIIIGFILYHFIWSLLMQNAIKWLLLVNIRMLRWDKWWSIFRVLNLIKIIIFDAEFVLTLLSLILRLIIEVLCVFLFEYFFIRKLRFRFWCDYIIMIRWSSLIFINRYIDSILIDLTGI